MPRTVVRPVRRARSRSLVHAVRALALALITTLPITTAPATAATPRASTATVVHVLASAVAAGADGSDARPYPTIAAALAAAPTGATVEVGAGTYREGGLRIERPVVLEAAAGARPVITGADRVTAWSRSDDGTWTSDEDMVRFCDVCTINADPAKEGMAAHPEQLWVDGKPLRQVATRAEVTAGTFYVDDPDPVTRSTAKDGTAVFSPKPHTGTRYVLGTDPSGHDVEIAQRARALTVAADDVTLRGLTIERFSPLQVWSYQDPETGGLTGAVMVSVSGARARIEDMVLSESAAGTALGLSGSDDSVVTGSTFRDNGADGLGVNGGDGAVIEGNSFEGNNTAGFLTVGCGAYCTIADMKATHATGLVYRGNVVDHTGAGRDASDPTQAAQDAMPGVWFDEGMIGSSVLTSYFLNVPVPALIEVSSRNVVASNVIDGAATGIRVSGSDRTRVEANTVVHALTSLEVREDSRHNGCNALASDGSCASVETWSAEHGLTWDTTGTRILDNLLAYPQRARDSSDPWRYTPMVRVLGAANDDGSGSHWANEMIERMDGDVYLREPGTRRPADTDVLWKAGPGKGDSVNATDLDELRGSAAVTVPHLEAHGTDLRAERSHDEVFADLPSDPTDLAGADLRLAESSPAAEAGPALDSDVASLLGLTEAEASVPARGAVLNVAWGDGKAPTTTSYSASAAAHGDADGHESWRVIAGATAAGAVIVLITALVVGRRRRARARR